MKKTLLILLLLAVMIPTAAFAATRTNPVDLFKDVVGKDPVAGTPLFEQAEAAGQGEAFFNANREAKIDYIKQLVEEKVLTQAEADLLIDRMSEHTYADMQAMRTIREKLRDANADLRGFGGMMGQGSRGMRGQGGRGLNGMNCLTPEVQSPSQSN